MDSCEGQDENPETPGEEEPGSNPGEEGARRAGNDWQQMDQQRSSESRCTGASASADCALLSITGSSSGWEEIPGVLSMESVCPQQLLEPEDRVGLV